MEGPFPDQFKPPLVEDHEHEEKRGGWRAVKYILVNETFEKLASMSLIANITVYLKTKYNMEGIMLVNVVTVWSGSSNILTIFGALLSDLWLGRFHTLFIGSIASLVGMGGMTLTSATPKTRPPKCNPQPQFTCAEPNKWQLGILYTALGFLAIGSGCIRPCNIAFGADQFSQKTEKGRVQLQHFYNLWYLSFTAALLVALTIVVYIQTNVSWVAGFAIPTGCFVISISGLLIGCHTYVYNKPQGSIFVDMAKVVVASFRKRKLSICDSYGEEVLYDPTPVYGSELSRTCRLKFFEKAALITHPGELTIEGVPAKSWRLCSLQQVEQLKCLVGILPVWVTSILTFQVMDQQNTFGVLQAIQMDRRVFGNRFTIPPGWIGLTSMVALSVWILMYERIVIPILEKVKKKKGARLSVKQRIRIGILLSILCMVVAGFVEKQRRNAAIKAGTLTSPLSIWHLVPQLVLSGMVEAFASVAILEFFTTQMPESMRSIAGSVFFLSLSMGSYLSSAIVNTIYKMTKNEEGQAWLGGQDLNRDRLNHFYFIVAGIGALNFLYFTLFASKYVFVGEYYSNDTANTIGLTGVEVSLSRELSRRSSNA